jgi:hypothetical protein
MPLLSPSAKGLVPAPSEAPPVTDEDRFKLRFGPYQTPVFRYGDTAFCEVRGEVILCGLTAGRIPWPVGKRAVKGRGPGPSSSAAPWPTRCGGRQPRPSPSGGVSRRRR